MLLSIGLTTDPLINGINVILLETNGDTKNLVGQIFMMHDQEIKKLFFLAKGVITTYKGNLKEAILNYPIILEKYEVAFGNIAKKIRLLKQYTRTQRANISTLEEVIFFYTYLCSEAIKNLLKKLNKKSGEIDVIGFHNQCLFGDNPEMQLTNSDLLATLTGITVVNNLYSGSTPRGAEFFSRLAVRSLKGLPPETSENDTSSLSSGYARIPPAGASQLVETLLEINSGMLEDYRDSATETHMRAYRKSASFWQENVIRSIMQIDFSKWRLPPIKNKLFISKEDIEQNIIFPVIRSHCSEELIADVTKSTCISYYSKRCYQGLFQKIHRPSDALSYTSKKSEPEQIPLLTDLELAEIRTHGQLPVLCIEGGGTYFRFTLLDKFNPYTLSYENQKNTVIKTRGCNCNVLGWETFFSLLDQAIYGIQVDDSSLAKFIYREKPLIVIGMAGMGSEKNRHQLRSYFINRQAKLRHVLITTDADSYLALLPGYGAVLIAGTGSICLGLTPEGKRIQAGGFGAQLSGDPGSAFAVGHHALLACFNLKCGAHVWDEIAKSYITKKDSLYTQLMKKFPTLWPNSSINELVAYLNKEPNERSKLAEIAPIVFDYAFNVKPPSLLALKIINQIAKELAQQVAEVVEAMFSSYPDLKKNQFPIVLVGGIFDNTHYHKLLLLIEENLKIMQPELKIAWENSSEQNTVSRVVSRALSVSPAPIYRFGR